MLELTLNSAILYKMELISFLASKDIIEEQEYWQYIAIIVEVMKLLVVASGNNTIETIGFIEAIKRCVTKES